MKQIPLYQIETLEIVDYALVDDEDYQEISKHKWFAIKSCNTSYAIRYTITAQSMTSTRMHRQILNINDSKVYVDHKDHNGLNNQRSNIRLCTPKQNRCNIGKHLKGTSKYKGVIFHKGQQAWVASIGNGKDRYHLGTFNNEVEAAAAYNIKAKELFGEFAFLNDIPKDIIPQRRNSPSSSKYKGVSFIPSMNKWRAYGWKNNSQIHLGLFDTEDEAGRTRDTFVKEHKQDVRMNFLKTSSNQRPSLKRKVRPLSYQQCRKDRVQE